VGERNEDPSLGDLRLTTCYLAPGLFLETWLFTGARVVGHPEAMICSLITSRLPVIQAQSQADKADYILTD
jgi:hypothetical protein